MNYYEILEISETASDDIIKMAYKTLAKKYHPDLFKGDPKIAEEKMKEINKAYDILSNPEKRSKYDSQLHNKSQTSYEYKAAKAEAPSDKDTKKNKPTDVITKSNNLKGKLYLIFILLFIVFTQTIHPYIESDLLYNFAPEFGLRDFAFLNLITMTLPLFTAIFKEINTEKEVKNITQINSIVLFVISLILYILEVTDSLLLGGTGALLYYFINKHVLLKILEKQPSKKKKSVILIALILVLITIFSISNSYTSAILEEINSYDSQNDSAYVGIRIIHCPDKRTASSILSQWEEDGATEQAMIMLMHKFDSTSNQIYYIYDYEVDYYVEEIFTWCFAEDRQVGDAEIIYNPYGYSICYISEMG